MTTPIQRYHTSKSNAVKEYHLKYIVVPPFKSLKANYLNFCFHNIVCIDKYLKFDQVFLVRDLISLVG